jgi:hypothetical protein
MSDRGSTAAGIWSAAPETAFGAADRAFASCPEDGCVPELATTRDGSAPREEESFCSASSFCFLDFELNKVSNSPTIASLAIFLGHRQNFFE